jgi:ankyrin repeat protein
MGYYEIVQLLVLDGRAEITSSDNFAIIEACRNNHFKIVKLLLEDKRADPAVQNNYAIYIAIAIGHIDVFSLLWMFPGSTPLMLTIAFSLSPHETAISMLSKYCLKPAEKMIVGLVLQPKIILR